MSMFKNQIKFVGKHAVILQKYCKDKGSEQDMSFEVSNNSGETKVIYLFETRINCYMVAGMLGILNKRTAEIDNDKNITTVANIFAEVLEKNRSNLERMYHHMILSEDNELSPDAKIKKAFSIIPDEKCDEEQHKLENFVRGGLEILDEIFSKCKTYEDVCNAMFDIKDMLNLCEESE